jgi:hypothetical protein
MSVAGIGASSIFNLSTGSLQSTSQAQQQQFQALAQQLQSSEFSGSSNNVSALQQEFLQAGGLSAPAASSGGVNASSSSNATSSAASGATSNSGSAHAGHFHHRLRLRVDSGLEGDSNDSSDEWSSLSTTSPATAQSAYASTQGLQQVALNSDLINAQASLLQSNGISLTA